MTQERILELAYDGALAIWAEAKEKAVASPYNGIFIHKEAVAWTELQEIERLLKK